MYFSFPAPSSSSSSSSSADWFCHTVGSERASTTRQPQSPSHACASGAVALSPESAGASWECGRCCESVITPARVYSVVVGRAVGAEGLGGLAAGKAAHRGRNLLP